jgi:uncharacterized membrane protein YjjP (DUF1212 family)
MDRIESPSPKDATHRFLTEMPRALSMYGTPAHRLEEAMGLCAERLGIPAGFFALPTSVICTIGEGEDSRTHVVRVTPGEVNLKKLDEVDAVMGRLLRGEIGAKEGLAQIHAIREDTSGYSVPLTMACFSVAAGGASQFFGGSWMDMAFGAAFGLFVGLGMMLAASRRDLSRLTDFVAGVMVAALALLIGGRIEGVSPAIVTIAGLIALFPGLTLTVAINELATKNLVAGTARLMGAVMILLSIGFGVAVGQAVVERWSIPAVPGVSAPPITQILTVILVPLSLVVLLKARVRDAWIIVLVSAAGFYAARLGAQEFDSGLGAGFGAFVVGVLGNGYARWSRRPTAMTLVPGIILLVPGVVGFRSVSSFIAHDAVTGIETAFNVMIVATGIVIGLLMANVLVPSKQSL